MAQRLRPERDRPLFKTENKSARVCLWREKTSGVQDEAQTHTGAGSDKAMYATAVSLHFILCTKIRHTEGCLK